jgi:septal ring factor EnvC (AmiA/AmiB activator)
MLWWQLQSAEEVARWNERKRWQQTVEKQKQKLKEKTAEVETLHSTIRSLRDTTNRLEREKIVLDNRLRASRSRFWFRGNIFILYY